MTSFESKQIANDVFESSDSLYKKPLADLMAVAFIDSSIMNVVVKASSTEATEGKPRAPTRSELIRLYDEAFEQYREGCAYLCGKCEQENREAPVFCVTYTENSLRFAFPKTLLNPEKSFKGYLVNNKITFVYDSEFDTVQVSCDGVLLEDIDVGWSWI